ncbi:hypothetical protein VTP01DRAFT_171 [Rhizomucor pusillus]|uniref:uncharacterized protein n=1 Tax=Rhizomucor pusillus TaxID=4840 RepID=UPI0037430F08
MANPEDPASFTHKHCHVNGINMHYIDENETSNNPLVLIHGWPDLWLGWRNQIPFLAKLGYRVIVPSLRGFGETDAPADPAEYGFGTVSKDIAALLDYLELPTVTIIGHDWGGAVVWRFTQFYPERVKAVASFCTPYTPPNKEYIPLEIIVKALPNFTYQLYLGTPEAEEEIDENPEGFFARVFQPYPNFKGGLIDKETKTLVRGRPPVEKSDKVPQKVFDYYVNMWKAKGARGGLNWYKQTWNNFEQCKNLDPIIRKPAMMVTADKDAALPPSMAANMNQYIPDLEMHNVENAGHWVLWEKPTECNQYLHQWLSKVSPAKL